MIVRFKRRSLEIARALATQASLAIQLTQLARTARESAVLEERNRLAGEIHDSLAQSFAGISMQLSHPVVREGLTESLARPELSPRELQVLRRLAAGNSNKEIGEMLQITEHTVKAHVKAILLKLGALGRTKAIAIAIKRGLTREG
jgi:DNA-binding NarL/FixJ family response regulator